MRAVRRRTMLLLMVVLSLLAMACSGDDSDDSRRTTSERTTETTAPPTSAAPVEPLHHGSFASLIPRPSEATAADGELLLVTTTALVVAGDAAAQGADRAAELLRGYLGPATGLELPVVTSEGEAGPGPLITFAVAPEADGLGPEGYQLTVEPDGATVRASAAAGFGWAVQTIRQLLAPEIESTAAQPGTFGLPAGTVRDVPRFTWRGAMLDVARHFFPPEEVERVIDLLALYKLNRFHLHLSDDQGWRLQIERYPELTTVGAATEIGGGPGGFYTQDQYRSLVDYAAARGIVIVPEFDMPGHTAAALASVPGLNCPDVPAPAIATSFSNGQSSLCVGQEATDRFVEDVIGEVAALTPGPYIHIGADEARATGPEDYQHFVERAGEIVRAAGKQLVGWDEVATTDIAGQEGTVVQLWQSTDRAVAAVDQGASLVMSPSSRAYMDMKYDDSTPIGLRWAGLINSRKAYEWDPASFLPGLPADRILGLEAPLWTETVTTLAEIEQMMLPRLPAYAELGWSSPDGRSWDEYRVRLAAQAARWSASGRAYTRDPVVGFPG